MNKAFEILKKLKPNEPLFLAKLDILHKLIVSPNAGHLLDKELVEWAKSKGIKVKLSCADKISWWNCWI